MLYDIPATLFLFGALAISITFALGIQVFIHRRYKGTTFISHNEVGGILVVVVATIYAVLLGFLTVVAWEHFQEARGIVVTEADASIDAWHTAVGLPEPVRQHVRQDMVDYAAIMVAREWAAMKRGQADPDAGKISMRAMEEVGGFVPRDGHETNAQNLTMDQLGILHDARQRRIASNEAGLVGFEWIVLFIGAGATISFCWLFGSNKPVVHMVMTATVVTMIVSMLVLLFELQSPFRSSIGVTSEAWVAAREHDQQMMHGAMAGMQM